MIRTLTLLPKLKLWRLFLYCLLSMLVALSIAMADESSTLGSSRDFWVWDLRVMPPAFRKAHATLRASGARSLVYVEDKFWGGEVKSEFVNRLSWQLETAMPYSAIVTDTGIVPFEERLFGPLPQPKGGEDRLIVLFADLGQYKDTIFDGFFNSFDRLSDHEAMDKYQQHSNELNIIYLNGFRKSEEYTTGVVAHELQHLLAAALTTTDRETWLSETLAEGAMLLSGFFGDQGHVDTFAKDSGRYSLVTPSYVQYGPQLLFSSFLMDALPHMPTTAIGALSRSEQGGRNAVESLFLEQTGVPLNFDAIFSNFVSYVFGVQGQNANLPSLWHHSAGINVPKINSYFQFKVGSGELNGLLAPFSFIAVDLAQQLSPLALISVEHPKSPSTPPPAGSCAADASLLWKPITPSRIAIYAVGCDPSQKNEMIPFRLRILDQPSLIPASPLTLFR